MALPIFMHPSTVFQEIDLTQRLQLIVGTIASVTGEFERGPLGPVYQRGTVQGFRDLYGQRARPDISFAHDTCTQYMRESGNLLVNRVVNNALHSGLTVYRDRANNYIDFDPFPAGSVNGADKANFDAFFVLSFTENAFASGQGFTMDVTDGQRITSVTVPYTTNHNSTVDAIASAVKVALDSFVIGGSARVVRNTTRAAANNTTILIRVSRQTVLEFISPVITGSGSKPVVTLDGEARMFDVYSENPGAWSDNQIGVRLNNINPGVRERYRFTMSRNLITGNSLSVTANGTTITQTYDTSSDNTLALLAAKLTAHPDVASAEVEQVPGGTDNDRSLLIISRHARPGAIAWTNLDRAITGGSAQGIIAIPVVMTGVASDNSFYLEVFERANANIAVARYEVTLNANINRLGYQQKIDQLVNLSSRRSELIRVSQPDYSTRNYSLFQSSGEPLRVENTVAWLTGGTDGLKCTSAEIRTGLQKISDRRRWPMNLILNAGYTAISVQKEIAHIAEKRSDCTGILDAPSDKQQAQTLRQYRLEELDIDSSFVAMYTPDTMIEDDVTAEKRYIPPSGPVGATYAYSDRLTNGVGAPAGLNRGKTPSVLGLRYNYSPEEMDLIYPVGINYIEDRPGIGPVVMAEETLQFMKSIRSSVHARRILNNIKTALVDGMDYTLFDPNTDSTRFRALQLGESVCGPYKKGDGSGGLVDYKLICDDSNNTPDVIESDQLAFAAMLKIVRVIKGVGIKGILTPQGAQFEEYEADYV